MGEGAEPSSPAPDTCGAVVGSGEEHVAAAAKRRRRHFECVPREQTLGRGRAPAACCLAFLAIIRRVEGPHDQIRRRGDADGDHATGGADGAARGGGGGCACSGRCRAARRRALARRRVDEPQSRGSSGGNLSGGLRVWHIGCTARAADRGGDGSGRRALAEHRGRRMPVGGVPHQDGRVLPHRDERVSVERSCKRNGVDRRAVVRQYGLRVAVTRAPHPRGAVNRRGHQPPVARRDDHLCDLRRVATKRVLEQAGDGAPNLDVCIIRTCVEPQAGLVKGAAVDGGAMPA